jgi:hypothetical protein
MWFLTQRDLEKKDRKFKDTVLQRALHNAFMRASLWSSVVSDESGSVGKATDKERTKRALSVLEVIVRMQPENVSL